MITTDTDSAQHDTDAQAGEPGAASTDDNRPPASEPDDQHDQDLDDQDLDDADQDHDDADDTDDHGSRSNREKRYRLRLRDAERERDEARDLLARTRATIVDNTVTAAGVDPRLMAAAGHTVDTLLGDDGLIDAAKLADAITATAREFRVPPLPTRPAPVLQQGHTNGGGTPGKSSWAGAIKGG